MKTYSTNQIILLLSVLLIGFLGYLSYTKHIELSWVKSNLNNTEVLSYKWIPIDEANKNMTNLKPIKNITLPVGWVFDISDEDWKTVTIRDFKPSEKYNTDSLIGGKILINIAKIYKDSNEFLEESKNMYSINPRPFREILASFKNTSIDGHQGYRVEGKYHNISPVGTSPNISIFLESATFADGYTVSFNLLIGDYTKEEDTAKYVDIFNQLIDSVKLGESS